MKAILRALWRALRAILLALLAPVMFIEEWGWVPLTACIAWLTQWPPLARLEQWLRAASPRVALAMFCVGLSPRLFSLAKGSPAEAIAKTVAKTVVSCQGSNAACSLALKPDGVVASRRHSTSL